ncbi:hypothetical protein KDX30_19865 [Pseudomonas sp. CDFA 553]|uniref:hypothetical protein n=1 Tax=Pseudomonas quasicaspiana TaxID=2829821 RepID=UPI001E3BF79E|nr:hypothetical protein [Pseudomonas quasicaspiana]MCD5990149.1 hypothetical protein [Pseudomonas quasicaspiana]
MHIKVIADPASDASLAEIKRLGSVMEAMGYASNTVFAEAYGAAGLVTILEVRADRGQTEILVIDCTRDQVQAVLEWQACDDDQGMYEDLVIHLVRKA